MHTNILRIRLQVEAVTEEILPSRARTFPDAFVKGGAKTGREYPGRLGWDGIVRRRAADG